MTLDSAEWSPNDALTIQPILKTSGQFGSGD
jgi:hypothetical protein